MMRNILRKNQAMNTPLAKARGRPGCYYIAEKTGISGRSRGFIPNYRLESRPGASN
jgi:hypothetical protein